MKQPLVSKADKQLTNNSKERVQSGALGCANSERSDIDIIFNHIQYHQQIITNTKLVK
jgi:hypothetical protein